MTVFSRRDALGTAGSVVVSFALFSHATAQPKVPAGLPGDLDRAPFLDSWIRIDPKGITVFTGKAELGQGLKTAMVQVAAEQLDVDPAAIRLITADTAQTPDEGVTAGSHSMQDSATAVMNAAAQARALLLAAAAKQWKLEPNQLSVRAGRISAPDGRNRTFAKLAGDLSLHVAAQPDSPLKKPEAFTVIGRSMPRVDIPPKLTGGAAYVQDLRLPNMLHARVVRPPSYGARLLSLDQRQVEAMPGVVKVIRDGSYLAVVAQREWEATRAQRALSASAKWQESAVLPDHAHQFEALQRDPAQSIPVATKTGNGAAPARTLRARYTRPYLMHASIGPSCAVAQLLDGRLTVWTHSQGVFPLRKSLAELLRVPVDTIRCVHTEGSGCYGHNGADDAAADAALIARALPGRPIRVQWMREQEHRWEPYGPAMIVEAEGGLDRKGRIVDWRYDVWSNTHSRRPHTGGLFVQNTALANPLPVPPPRPIPMPEGGGDRNSIPLYEIPNLSVAYHMIEAMPLRVSALRSLGGHMNVFAIESFMDELANAAGADPVAFRLRHLRDPRAMDVIELAAAKFGWPEWRASAAHSGKGFAFARYKNLAAYCAIALDVAADPHTGSIQIGRVVAAVDVGQAINPDGVRNQIEGAIVQSASWTTMEEVKFDRKHILSVDWATYPILRFAAVPQSIEVHVIDRPGLSFLGTGEAGQGPPSAAIANAVAHATGQRIRDLPISSQRLRDSLVHSDP